MIKNETAVETGIEDTRLYTLLQAEISSPFYFAAEYAEVTKICTISLLLFSSKSVIVTVGTTVIRRHGRVHE